MCVNYTSPEPQRMRANFKVEFRPDKTWKTEVWQDYDAPIIVGRDGDRVGLVASYGLVPKDKCPPGVRLTTMNARSETVGSLRTYRKPWSAGQLCLVPMMSFYEPNYESGHSVRWRIKLTDDEPFAVAGLWQEWDAGTEKARYSFTQLTINADQHPFMKRFHKPGEERRSLVIVAPDDYDAWLNCRNPEIARSFLQLYPADRMTGEPKPIPPRAKKDGQLSL